MGKKKLKHEIAWLKTQLRIAEIQAENAQRETKYAERRNAQLRCQVRELGEEPTT